MTTLFAKAVLFLACTAMGGLGLAVWFEASAKRNPVAADAGALALCVSLIGFVILIGIDLAGHYRKPPPPDGE